MSEVQALLPLPPAVLALHEESLGQAMAHWSKNGKFPAALLLAGPRGSGKRAFAHHLAQALLCPKSAESASLRPCGECGACRKVRTLQHVDFAEISPESAEEGRRGSIPVEALRSLQETQGFGAAEGRYRVTLIRDAELLTPQAANSFLKILEEPPPGWVFLLTAQDPSLLLPTIVSRCQKARLRPLPDSFRGERGKPGDESAERIARFLGRPGAELLPFVEWASQGADRIQAIADALEAELAERMAAAAEAGNPALPGLFRCAEAIERHRARAHAPLNRKLQAQELLSPWADLDA